MCVLRLQTGCTSLVTASATAAFMQWNSLLQPLPPHSQIAICNDRSGYREPLQQVLAIAYLIEQSRSGLLLSSEPSPAAVASPAACSMLLLAALPALASGCAASDAVPELDSSTDPANRKDGRQLPPVLVTVTTLNTRLTSATGDRRSEPLSQAARDRCTNQLKEPVISGVGAQKLKGMHAESQVHGHCTLPAVEKMAGVSSEAASSCVSSGSSELGSSPGVM